MAYLSWADVEKITAIKDAEIAKLRAELLAVSKLANDRGDKISVLEEVIHEQNSDSGILADELADQKRRIVEAVGAMRELTTTTKADVLAAIDKACEGE